MPKIVVVLHLYYQDLWSEFAAIIKNLEQYNYRLYVTLTKGAAHLDQTSWIVNQIKSRFNAKVFTLPNKGTDNGPFIYCLNEMLKADERYDYLLKLHTKKSLLGSSEMCLAKVWRQQLIQPIAGTPEAVKECLGLFGSRQEIGMIGSKKHVTGHINTNRAIIAEYLKLLNIKKTDLFIGGNMFWVRFSIIKNLLKDIDLTKMYDTLEDGYVTDAKHGTRTHSLERIWGYAVTNAGFRLHGIM